MKNGGVKAEVSVYFGEDFQTKSVRKRGSELRGKFVKKGSENRSFGLLLKAILGDRKRKESE